MSEEDNDNKSEFVPLALRAKDQSQLDSAALETLDRLAAKGEFLMHEDLTFSQAEELLRGGYAEKVRTYGPLTLIQPTPKGRALAAIRAEMKEARLRQRLNPPK